MRRDEAYLLDVLLDAMMPCLTTEWGNPSSSYKFGSKLKGVIEAAREQVAQLIRAHPPPSCHPERSEGSRFTSCATESNNTAIAAALKTNPRQAPHRHLAGGAFFGAELLHGAGEGGMPGHIPARRP